MEYLTMVAVLKEKSIDISVDPKCIQQLGIEKSLYAYMAIRNHCECVIAAMVEDIGQLVIAKTGGE